MSSCLAFRLLLRRQNQIRKRIVWHTQQVISEISFFRSILYWINRILLSAQLHQSQKKPFLLFNNTKFNLQRYLTMASF